jgi:hypothetical protein
MSKSCCAPSWSSFVAKGRTSASPSLQALVLRLVILVLLLILPLLILPAARSSRAVAGGRPGRRVRLGIRLQVGRIRPSASWQGQRWSYVGRDPSHLWKHARARSTHRPRTVHRRPRSRPVVPHLRTSAGSSGRPRRWRAVLFSIAARCLDVYGLCQPSHRPVLYRFVSGQARILSVRRVPGTLPLGRIWPGA